MPMTNRHITGVDGCGKGDGEETVFGALSVPSSGVFRAMRRRAYDKCDEQTVEMITRHIICLPFANVPKTSADHLDWVRTLLNFLVASFLLTWKNKRHEGRFVCPHRRHC